MSRPPAPTNIPGLPADRPARLAFLGPHGTFTEQALWQVAGAGAQLLPCTSVPAALDAVRTGRADQAVVPIENSIEGGVNATLDSMVNGSPLVIAAEMVVPVSFVLAVKPGTKLADVKRVSTHPHAWAQCRQWASKTLGEDAVHLPATSTAAAAQLLANGENPGFDAALCNVVSVERYGLEALVEDVADNAGAVTRFILAAKPGVIPRRTGADKTTVQVRLPDDKSGALLTMLEQFSARGVNLSRIESRPAGGPLGSYSFSIDIWGHIHDERVQAAMIGLHRTCPEVTFLGSYARVDGLRPEIRPGTTDEDFRAGRAWLRTILDA